MTSGTLEDTLARVEKALEGSLKAAQSVQASLRKAKSAAKAGALRDLDRAIAASSAAASDFGRHLEACKAAWTFDAEAYFTNGGYKTELFQAAVEAGLQITERDGRIACYPMLLRLAARELAVIIDRKQERRVRPAVLVKLLAQRQRQPPKMSVGALLETIASAYELVAPRLDRNWTIEASGPGPSVPLIDIHKTLTLWPDAARDYPLAEFARDLHLLDRSPGTRTRDGRSFRFEASTGGKTLRRLPTVDQHGVEHSYVAIRLIRE